MQTLHATGTAGPAPADPGAGDKMFRDPTAR